MVDKYTNALKREIKQWGGKINRPIDTIYLGGGTPSLLNERLSVVLNTVRQNFNVLENCEITLELNPQSNVEEILKNAKTAGINRLSIGVQTSNDNRLLKLGRTHSKTDVENAVCKARSFGFSNISLDLMIGLPDSNLDTLKADLEFLLTFNPEHISAYILKIETNTAFERQENSLSLPSEDEICDQYLFMCEFLENKEFSHYEISNFAKPDFESRHNLKYWNCEEYLGIGPSAHSFLDNKRFFYPRDLKNFIKGSTPLPDGEGGSEEEKLMLALRLKDGVCANILPQTKVELFVKNGLAKLQNGKFSLTNKGMLVSNQIITELLENIYENT